MKRRNVAGGPETGLGFSHEILSELLMRRGGDHIIVRIPLDEPVSDLLADISLRVQSAGFALNTVPSPGGVEPSQAAPEAAARDQASRLASAVNEAAAVAARTVWFFVDNPSVPLSEPARLQLEGFVAACLTQPQVRLVVAGLETMPLAGLEFAGPAGAGGDGPAGMVVDYVGRFSRADILDCLTRAAEELAGGADPAAVDVQADLAVLGLGNFNGEFEDSDLETVVGRLQPYLRLLRQRAGGTP